MRTRIVPGEEVTSKSLHARNYIKDYDKKIIKAFKDASKANGPGEGASPTDVTTLLAERGELSPLDTVIDIADLMKELRDLGRL
jgi:hypothetical protein